MSSGLKLGLGREEEDEDGESCRLGLGLCFVSCPRVLVGPDQLRGRLNYLSIFKLNFLIHLTIFQNSLVLSMTKSDIFQLAF